MNTIRIPVETIKLDLFSEFSAKPKPGGGPRLKALDNGLALPSFWTTGEINKDFKQTDEIWAQAGIAFGPIKLKELTVTVPADDKNMWTAFVNKLSPTRGLSASFVYDLPSCPARGRRAQLTATSAGSWPTSWAIACSITRTR